MGERKATSTLGIHTIPELPDVVLVTRNTTEPDAIPVIPTPEAETYWVLHATPVPRSRTAYFTDSDVAPEHPSRWRRRPGKPSVS